MSKINNYFSFEEDAENQEFHEEEYVIDYPLHKLFFRILGNNILSQTTDEYLKKHDLIPSTCRYEKIAASDHIFGDESGIKRFISRMNAHIEMLLDNVENNKKLKEFRNDHVGLP